MRIVGDHAVQLFRLTGAHDFIGVQAPGALQQALPAQHLVTAGDAAGEIVRHVKQCPVGIGDLAVQLQQRGIDAAGRGRVVGAGQVVHRRLYPGAPMTQQAALEAEHHRLIVPAHRERRHQVQEDMIVVARVERDAALGLRRDHAAHDIQGAITVERRHLDGDNVIDSGKAAPEFRRQQNAADRRLQIKADKGNAIGNRLAMGDQLILAGTLVRRQAQQPRMITKAKRNFRLGQGLFGAPDQTGDHDRGPVGPSPGRFRGQTQDRFVQSHVANFELCRMHANRQAARTRVQVIAGQGTLMALIQVPRLGQGQGMGGDDHAVAQLGQNLPGQILAMQRHYPLPRLKFHHDGPVVDQRRCNQRRSAVAVMNSTGAARPAGLVVGRLMQGVAMMKRDSAAAHRGRRHFISARDFVGYQQIEGFARRRRVGDDRAQIGAFAEKQTAVLHIRVIQGNPGGDHAIGIIGAEVEVVLMHRLGPAAARRLEEYLAEKGLRLRSDQLRHHGQQCLIRRQGAKGRAQIDRIVQLAQHGPVLDRPFHVPGAAIGIQLRNLRLGPIFGIRHRREDIVGGENRLHRQMAMVPV